MTKCSSRLFIAVCTLTLISSIASVQSAVVISNFGTNIAPTDLQGSWVGSYTSASSTVVANDGVGSGISQYPAFAFNISGLNQISITASVAAINPNSNFQIRLEDVNGKYGYAYFNWSSFSTSLTQVTSTLAPDSGFNYSNVIGWNLDTGGLGSALSVTFSDISAVPEPSAVMLLGAAMSGLALCRMARRKA